MFLVTTRPECHMGAFVSRFAAPSSLWNYKMLEKLPGFESGRDVVLIVF